MGNHRGFWRSVKSIRLFIALVALLFVLFIWKLISSEPRLSSPISEKAREEIEPETLFIPAPNRDDVTANNNFPPIFEEEKYIRKFEGVAVNQDKAIIRKERDSRIEAPKEAAKNKDWELFLSAVDNLYDMPDIILHNTISSAILHNAPIYVFEELLARGASFLGRHTVMLAMYDNLPLMKKLIPLGLDIHGMNYRRDNAINGLLVSFSSREALNFLLGNGVEIQNGSNDIDPLMLALLKAETNKEAAYYAFMLVKYDAEVTSEHIAQVEKISERNPEAHKLLITNISEFR